jgi:hypothetical protein
MIPMDEAGNITPLTQDTKRQFLYVRYNADLSREGLDSLGLVDVDRSHVSEMDSVKYINDLVTVGKATGKAQVKMEHFGKFAETM